MATALKPGREGRATLADVGSDGLREADAPTSTTDFAETRWAVGRLSDTGLERLATFLMDLGKRAPLNSPAWAAHRLVLEALEADLQRERLARKEGGSSGP